MSESDASTEDAQKKRLLPLSLAALGIVYGDIGTSPLYAFRESFLGGRGMDVDGANILGVLSLIVWSLIIVISIKYLLIVMRADNKGEGGIIALVALLSPGRAKQGLTRSALILLGLFGAGLLYGDGTITPAISVLSAVEGLNIATSAFEPYIVPITVAILLVLFAMQRHGTHAIGRLFGPIMLIWFAVLGILGIMGIMNDPSVIRGLNPAWAVEFLATNQFAGLLVMGAVFLVVTGGETLYADMGHFGPAPIRLAWFAFVLPCLLLNYFGQGALVLAHHGEIEHPFYHLAPDWGLYPLVGLATVATVIASQAVISGVFSLTRQAIQMDFLPRLRVVQTHGEQFGQIYLPTINWMLMIATIGLVLGFKSSGALASAYGVAIATDMVITTILTFFILRHWGWNLAVVLGLGAALIIVDLAFFSANLFKIFDGGWYPLAVGAAMFVIMTTWNKGRGLLLAGLAEERVPIEDFVAKITRDGLARTPGAAIFMTKGRADRTPAMLMHQVQHIQALEEIVVFFHVKMRNEPRVPAGERLEIEALGPNLYSLRANYGFMQNINVPAALKLASKTGLELDLDELTYYLGRETLVPDAERPGMAMWRDNLFVFLSRNSHRATAYYGIPPEQVVELGIQVPI